MIKRVLFNKVTAAIIKFFPTNTTVEKINEDLTALYVTCTGEESSLTQITNAKTIIINKLVEQINTKTDSIIENDFYYRGVYFDLTLENQFNWSMDVQQASSLTYPYRVRSKDGDFMITSAADYVQFITNGGEFIRTTLQTGWDIKNALNSKTIVELLNWVDPR